MTYSVVVPMRRPETTTSLERIWAVADHPCLRKICCPHQKLFSGMTPAKIPPGKF